MNDAVDVERERLDPKKRLRPIASGQLPIRLAIAVAIFLPIVAVAIALTYSPLLAVILLIYLLKQIAYSFYLKHVVIIDVLILAAGYVLRVIAGVVVITVTNFSPWLYVCVGAGSLFLAVAKRRQELFRLREGGPGSGAAFKTHNKDLLGAKSRTWKD